MRSTVVLFVILVAAVVAAAESEDRRWENPDFASVEDAVAVAGDLVANPPTEGSRARDLFTDLTLAEGDIGRDHSSNAMRRRLIDGIVVTHPTEFDANAAQKLTVDRFLEAVPRQRRILGARLARFGYPELEGLTYLRLVESVDAFAGIGASSDRMSRVGGVTYYCRYVVLPLSYVSRDAVAELSRNPGIDVAGTIRRWQNESYASLVNTFRHEMVHVHTNSALGVPTYSDRTAYPAWFHEGTATYLAADPHAGLSERYKEYQDLFFYLVQRHGVADLQRYYRRVLGGSTASEGLQEVYGIEGRSELFERSARWQRISDRGKTVIWIAAILIVLAAIRGSDHPTIGYLLVLAAIAIGLATATGLAEHLYGLRGPGVVLGAKLGFASVAILLATLGIRRVRKHTRRQTA